MSGTLFEADGPADPQRRGTLRLAGATAVAAMAGAMSALPVGPAAAAATPAGRRDEGPLGGRLQGVQHFGITVQNMDRAFAFYTEVLGGTEIMRDGDFHGAAIHYTLLAHETIAAEAEGVTAATIGVADLEGGAQRLDVRFVQFDNVVIELLQYRDADQPQGGGDSFAEPHRHTSPAFPRSMHVCFHIRDDVDFDRFIRDLEATAHARGMTRVRANRSVKVLTEDARRGAPMDANTLKISEGPSTGWSLIYCKGPEGEQIEFVQALGPVKRVFDTAKAARDRLVGAG